MRGNTVSYCLTVLTAGTLAFGGIIDDFEDGETENNPTWVFSNVGEYLVAADPQRPGNLVMQAHGGESGHLILTTGVADGWQYFAFDVEFLAPATYGPVFKVSDATYNLGTWFPVATNDPSLNGRWFIADNTSGSPDWLARDPGAPNFTLPSGEWIRIQIAHSPADGLIHGRVVRLADGTVLAERTYSPSIPLPTSQITSFVVAIEEVDWQYVDNICLAENVDCNDNGVPDGCEGGLGPEGTTEDCNANGMPDICEMAYPYSSVSGTLTPIDENHPQAYTVANPPVAHSDLLITFVASGDLDSDEELITVSLDGTPLGTVFELAGNACGGGAASDQLVVPVDQFNLAAADGAVEVTMAPSGDVSPCAGSSISLTVEYTAFANDCNNNGVLDECEPGDCDGNGLLDECEATFSCSANPPLDNPFVDGQQPFRDVLQDQGVGGVRQGIGSPVTPGEGPVSYSTITVQFSSPVALAPADIEVACSFTGDPPGSWPCPAVAATVGDGAGPYTIELSGAIPAGGCTSITFGDAAPGVMLRYEYLPGDVSMNGATNTQDLLALVQGLNGGLAILTHNLARYDINRSGIVNTQDLLRLVQILNGINATQAWNGVSLVPCD